MSTISLLPVDTCPPLTVLPVRPWPDPGHRRPGPRSPVHLRRAVLARHPGPVHHLAAAPAGGRPRRVPRRLRPRPGRHRRRPSGSGPRAGATRPSCGPWAAVASSTWPWPGPTAPCSCGARCRPSTGARCCACRPRSSPPTRRGRRASCARRRPSSSGGGPGAWPSACSSWGRTSTPPSASSSAGSSIPACAGSRPPGPGTATGGRPPRPPIRARRRRLRSAPITGGRDPRPRPPVPLPARTGVVAPPPNKPACTSYRMPSRVSK